MIRKGCIGLPSASLPPLGIAGVAVWPITGASGIGRALVSPIRRQISWYVSLRRMPHVDSLVACKPPKWALSKLGNSCNTLIVSPDAQASLKALARQG